MNQKVDVAILGAGTAGLSALAEVKKAKKSFVIIDPGPLGTTCARTGCMPSKVLIQVANDFHRRTLFSREGIFGGDALTVDRIKVLEYVRSLRDRFVSSVVKDFEDNRKHLISERAQFIEPNVIRAGQFVIQADRTIIATGSSPVFLPEWKDFSQTILTSENFFELKNLPSEISIIGVGAIGAEIGQALSRLGIKVTSFGINRALAGLTDPVVQEVAIKILSSEMNLQLGSPARLTRSDSRFQIDSNGKIISSEAVFASVGRKPNLNHLGLENIGAKFDQRGVPIYDLTSMQVSGLPIFLAGDVDSDRPLLHEAADEGRIAGYNSVNEVVNFCRRTPLNIAFTSPNIALVGSTFAQLHNINPAIGEVYFEGQGRSIIKQENAGVLRIYAEPQKGTLLGAEMIAPEGEHLAHLLALAIQRKLTVFELLQMPFYHPVIEEGLRTALKNLGRKIKNRPSLSDIAFCETSAMALS